MNETIKSLFYAMNTDEDVPGIDSELIAKLNSLTETQKETLNTQVQMNNVSETRKEEVNKLINNAIRVGDISPGYTIADYVDITINVLLNNEKIGNITELTKEVDISLAIPTNLPKLQEGYERIFTVYRIHNEEVKELKTTLNDDNTLTFKTDKFSDYIIAYKDVKKTSSTIKTTNTTNTSIINNPKTNDNIINYILLAILASTNLIIGRVYKNKLLNQQFFLLSIIHFIYWFT